MIAFLIFAILCAVAVTALVAYGLIVEFCIVNLLFIPVALVFWGFAFFIWYDM